MLRVLAKTTRRPPQTLAQVRPGHPLARGLIGAYLPANPSAKRVGNPVYKAGTDGLGFTVDSDVDHWQSAVAGTASCVSVNPTWTILAILNNAATGGGGADRVVYCERPTDTQIVKLQVHNDQNAATFGFLVVRDAGGAGLVYMDKGGAFDSMVNGRSVITAVRRSTTDHRIYINGVQTNSDTSTTVPDNFASCDGFIGHDPFDSPSYLEGVSAPLILAWNRALSDGEIARITANPWQIFKAAASNALVPVSVLASAIGPRAYPQLGGGPLAAGPVGLWLRGADTGGTTVALTGAAATTAVGTVAPAADRALTGNTGTSAAGTVGAQLGAALTGNAAAGSVGSVTPVRAGAITGAQATGAPGTVAPSTSISLTGNASTGAVGTVSPQASQTLTGAAGTGAAGAVTPNVVIPITGASATGAVGTVTASTGGSDVSAALTGVAGTGSAGTVSPALDNGLAGNAAAGSAGSVTPVRAAAITGVSATGTPGTVAPATSKALDGISATGAVGSTAPATAKTLIGNAGTGAAGNVSAASSKTLSGNAATGAAGAASPSVTVALTGVSATGAAGSVTAGADATQALSGVSAAGTAGTVGRSVTIALAGVAGTGAVGSVTAGQPLTGVAGTGSVGTIAPSSSGALTGTPAPGAAGSVGPDITIALTGVQAAGQVGTVSFVAGDITIALTGVEATGAAGVLAVAGEFSAIAAAVWSYVLANGKTAGQNVVEIRSMLDLLAPGFWNLAIEGTYTAADLLRVIAAVQAGKSTITALGGGAATVEFRAADDSETRVTATMAGSERTEVTLNVD